MVLQDEAVETKEADVVPAENQTDLVESHPEELSTMMPVEEIKTVNPALTVPLKDEKEEKNEDPVEPDLPKPIEEHQANEEEAKVPEDLQPEVKQLSVDIVAAPQVFDPVVETLEKAAWIVQSFSQDGELIDSVEVPHYEVNNLPEDKAQEEVSKNNSSQEALETKRQNSLETIKEGETVPKEKSSRVDLNGSAGKWDPNDAKAPPRSQKIIKVKATSVRENKKPLPVKSMDYGRVKNIPQVHFQAPRRNSVPLKKETKKEPKKKVEESEESQGEVVLVSPTGLTFDQLVNNIGSVYSAETSASSKAANDHSSQAGYQAEETNKDESSI